MSHADAHRLLFQTFLVLTCCQFTNGLAHLTAAEVDFSRDVQPILASKCWHCHGPDGETRGADLRLDDPEAAAYVLEHSEDQMSMLLERVLSEDPDERMPPGSSKKSLTPEEIEILKQWIEQGAPFTRHWAFQSPVMPEVPVIEAELNLHPIDAFIRDRLASERLRPSPMAAPATLVRRLALDLTGLPPEIEDVERFTNNPTEATYQLLVDKYLASPRYGEHLASSWLELARYADTDGYQNDRYRYMHVWRDWVVEAFNHNQPYDQFITEQLAGDLLPAPTLKQQIATGFCRNHRINSENGSIPEEWHVENIVDRVDTLGTAILGLTIACARCHDHKYDPISARDYYQLYAYFNNIDEWGVGPNNGNSPPFVTVPESWPNLSPEENVAQTPDPLRISIPKNDVGMGLPRPQPGGPNTVMVMHERAERRPTYKLMRGQFDAPDKTEELLGAIPEALRQEGDQPVRNRLELAQWLTNPQHPLTARVAVNRIWQQLFGLGIVKTSENFGMLGELPSHPELLDWLAITFIESGWDLKELHRTIVTSQTYRQSSRVSPRLVKRDPENRLLARGPRFRMHPFVLRDSALQSSGLLVEKVGGVPTKPYMPPGLWSSVSNNKYVQDHGENLYRRSLYTFWRRTIPPPTMVNFNAAEREVCLVRKERTNTPLQALTLMNNITFVESARFLAERMLHKSDDPSIAIDYGVQQVLARKPNAEELSILLDGYSEFAAHFAANEQRAEELLAVGEKPRDPSLDVINHAAMTMTATLILNLDEAITKE